MPVTPGGHINKIMADVKGSTTEGNSHAYRYQKLLLECERHADDA